MTTKLQHPMILVFWENLRRTTSFLILSTYFTVFQFFVVLGRLENNKLFNEILDFKMSTGLLQAAAIWDTFKSLKGSKH